MLNNFFKEEIDKKFEVNMDDMILKSNEEVLHDQHLNRVRRRV